MILTYIHGVVEFGLILSLCLSVSFEFVFTFRFVLTIFDFLFLLPLFVSFLPIRSLVCFVFEWHLYKEDDEEELW